jgi:hypothetical protein
VNGTICVFETTPSSTIDNDKYENECDAMSAGLLRNIQQETNNKNYDSLMVEGSESMIQRSEPSPIRSNCSAMGREEVIDLLSDDEMPEPTKVAW